MSATHPHVAIPAPEGPGFTERHPQLAPFLVGMAMFLAAGAVALLFTGLPA